MFLNTVMYLSGLCVVFLSWTMPAFCARHYGAPAPSSKLCSSSNCLLPDCFCAGRRAPQNMQTHDIPQMVMLSFDDAVNKQNMDFYRTILTHNRTNPNGCPITATFFVSHDWTDYKMVKELYLAGHEIADHSISHRLPRNWWKTATYRDWEEELEGQRKNIANKAGVPRFEVRGVRVPFLELGGDTQFELMTDRNFLYDSSFLTGPYNERDWRLPAWPYTLQFAPELEYCDSSTCPKSNFSGIWEVPLNRWLGLDGQACPMVDACTTQVLKTKSDALRYLWKNFNRHYGKNRAPFGINLHATWLEDEFKMDALQEFIDEILEFHDVYMINIAKVVEWMKQPTTLGAIVKFQPWLDCSNKRVLVQRRKPTRKPPTKLKKFDSFEEDYSDNLSTPKVNRKPKHVRESDEETSSEEIQRKVIRKVLKKKKKGRPSRKPSTVVPREENDVFKNGKGDVIPGDAVIDDTNDIKDAIQEDGDTSKTKNNPRRKTKDRPLDKAGKAGRAGTQKSDSSTNMSGGSPNMSRDIVVPLFSLIMVIAKLH